MKRFSVSVYMVDAVTAAKMLLGKWLCRRLPDGSKPSRLKATPCIGMMVRLLLVRSPLRGKTLI